MSTGLHRPLYRMTERAPHQWCRAATKSTFVDGPRPSSTLPLGSVSKSFAVWSGVCGGMSPLQVARRCLPTCCAPLVALAVACLVVTGCGINKSRLATEQLVVSDAVDRAVASIDFSPLSGRKVYFDTQVPRRRQPRRRRQRGVRHQLAAAADDGLRLPAAGEGGDGGVTSSRRRVGVLANDGHEVTYGIPGSAAMTIGLGVPCRAPCPLRRCRSCRSAAATISRAPPRSACSPTTARRASRSGRRAWPRARAGPAICGCSAWGRSRARGPVRKHAGRRDQERPRANRRVESCRRSARRLCRLGRLPAGLGAARTNRSREDDQHVQTASHAEPAKLITPAKPR